MIFFKAIWVAVLLSVSCFIFQAMNEQNWAVAMERSFFQTCAVLIFAFVISTWPEKQP